MTAVDYVVIVAAVAVLLGAGLFSGRRGARSAQDFILGGRKLPWWLGGAAMVAGATSCDSPLHQSGKVRREGLAGAWFYWCQILAVVWHSLVFSRLWRRTGVTTVVEFYDLRYSGRGSRAGRVWSMVFASLLGSTISLALSLLAMIKICQVLLDLRQPVLLAGHPVAPELVIVTAGVALALTYSVAAGLRGVVAGDLVEFLMVLVCSYVLTFFVLHRVGGPSGLQAGLAARGQGRFLGFTPHFSFSLVIFFFVQPLAQLAGDNGLNQRFLALRDERQAVFSGLWRMSTHYFLRAWPWYVCGLASILLVAGSARTSEMAYPELIRTMLPEGWRGLMFAGFLVAFMSCVGNAMHNAGVVFVNDFYRPFLVRQASERHYVWAIRATMIAVAAAGTWIALSSDQILRLLEISLTIVGASGLLMLLRWFWWRVNGWCDLAAQVAALPATLFFTRGIGAGWSRWLAAHLGQGSPDDLYGVAFLLTVAATTAAWLAVMWLTPAEPPATLERFFRRVRPYGAWGPIARRCPEIVVTDRFGQDCLRYAVGLAMALGFLFGIGGCFLGRYGVGIAALALGAAAAFVLVRSVDREYETRPISDSPEGSAVRRETSPAPSR